MPDPHSSATPHPSNLRVESAEVHRLLRQGDVDLASKKVAELLKDDKGASSTHVLVAAGRTKMHVGDHVAALEFARLAIKELPSETALFLAFDASMPLGFLDTAADALMQLSTSKARASEEYAVRRFKLALARRNQEEIAKSIVQMIDTGRTPAAVAKDTQQIPPELVREALRSSIEALGGREDQSLVTILLTARIAESCGDIAGLQKVVTELRRLHPNEQDWGPHFASISRQIPQAGDAGSLRVGAEHLVAFAPKNNELLRPLVEDRVDHDVVVSPCAPDAPIALVFTGLGDGVGLPLDVFDRYLAALGIGAIYLKDKERLLFANGVKSLGGVDGTRETFRRLADARRVVILGNSAGGFGAIRWAVEIGAEQALCFSPPISIVHDFLADMDPRATKTHTVLLARLREALPVALHDLRSFVLQSASRPKLTIYYGADNEVDAAHAEHLRGTPGVVLQPIKGFGKHSVVPLWAETGQLTDALRDAFFPKR